MDRHVRDAQAPTLRPADEMPPIVDQGSLEHMWQALIGEPGFASPQVWLLCITSGCGGRIAVIEQAPLAPGARDIEGLRQIVDEFATEADSVALLYARPGSGVRTPADIVWARGLDSIRTGWPVHLANDAGVRVVAPDDVA